MYISFTDILDKMMGRIVQLEVNGRFASGLLVSRNFDIIHMKIWIGRSDNAEISNLFFRVDSVKSARELTSLEKKRMRPFLQEV